MDKDISALINSSPKITVLTGAGVSTDSGIPDFQSYDAEWKFPVSREEAMSIWFFKDNPIKFWEIYRYIFHSRKSAEPNAFHYYLSSLQKNHQVFITTQNVDGLHQKAGSDNVIEFHGNCREVMCSKKTCRRVYPMTDTDSQLLPRCPNCRSVLRPNISLFGEGVHGFGDTRDRIIESDLIIVAGTSLNVGPFNELPLFASYSHRIRSLWINNDSPPHVYSFDYQHIGSLKSFLENN